MADQTAIEWADSTWSPWEGCTKVSPGCDNCYAEAMNRWLRKGENWGPGAPRRIYSEDHWDKPVKWQREATKFHTLHGRNRRVFPSVCDPFDNEAPTTLRGRLWSLIRLTPAIDWLLLTKRIGNAKSMLPDDWGDGYPNVWIGATVVNQDEADRDIPKLLATPARVRFLSIEPMLGPITLPGFNASTAWCPRCKSIVPDSLMAPHELSLDGPARLADFDPAVNCAAVYDMLHWVICGGESGPKARPMHPDWARSLRDQCAAAGVPFLFKQWGEWGPVARSSGLDASIKMPGQNRDLWAWPDGTRDGWRYGLVSMRISKKAAGRLLDGVEHNGFPEAPHG